MNWIIHHGDWVERLCVMPSESVNCVVTSPPYWGLRDYGVPGQLGLERTPEDYIAKMVEGFREVRRVLRSDGTLWLNLGDSYAGGGRGNYGDGLSLGQGPKHTNGNAFRYAGMKPKDLVGVPWLLAFALRADGWYLRSDIIWAKPNPMPESVTDRPTKAHEYIFLLAKSERYYYDAEAIKERAEIRNDVRPFGNAGGNRHGDEGKMYATPRNDGERWNENNGRGFLTKTKIPGGWDRGEGAHGTIHRDGRTSAEYQEVEVSPYRNKRSVWEIATSPFPEAHFATFPPKLVEPCILAGTSERGCCPKCGAPWERIVETSNPSKWAADEDNRGWANTHSKTSNAQSSKSLHRNGSGVYSTAQTVGWQPSCKCSAGDPIPCTVLDPFAGAGTTGLVALRYQRNFIGIELKQEYCEMASRRIEQDAPLFNSVGEFNRRAQG